jgi:hypothetical protein
MFNLIHDSLCANQTGEQQGGYQQKKREGKYAPT